MATDGGTGSEVGAGGAGGAAGDGTDAAWNSWGGVGYGSLATAASCRRAASSGSGMGTRPATVDTRPNALARRVVGGRAGAGGAGACHAANNEIMRYVQAHRARPQRGLLPLAHSAGLRDGRRTLWSTMRPGATMLSKIRRIGVKRTCWRAVSGLRVDAACTSPCWRPRRVARVQELLQWLATTAQLCDGSGAR